MELNFSYFTNFILLSVSPNKSSVTKIWPSQKFDEPIPIVGTLIDSVISFETFFSIHSKTTEKMLIKNGFKVVIYANHLLRASYPAMENAAKNILKNQRSYEIEKKISSVYQVINLIKQWYLLKV